MQLKVIDLYRLRFADETKTRNSIWTILCQDFFQKYINVADTVCDLGAGYCEFINNIKAKRRIAIDLNSDTKKYANKSVVTYIISSTEFSKKVKGVDLIFTSNFFEHLASKEDLIKTIDQIQKALKVKGKLIVLMPNIKYVGHKYWDFVDHQLPLTENAVIEALELNNFKVLEVKSRFLPYTTKSKIPKLDIFVKIYLRIPILQYMLGKQSLVVAEKINRKN